jgi:2-oxo-4-hydroxy-4-carboxy-5-ureidoimidazoline decarboxylase
MEPWHRLDLVTEEDARARLSTCCGSTRWVDRMIARRPFGSMEALLGAAAGIWADLSEDDWKEAFSQHPSIGDRDLRDRRFTRTRHLSEREQSGVAGATGDILDALAKGNRAYEAKFGYTFIVCATGRAAAEMLALLTERLENDPAVEIHVAASEQAQITELRLKAIE